MLTFMFDFHNYMVSKSDPGLDEPGSFFKKMFIL